MLQTEFLRSLNSNYERILLDNNPEEKRYQYCIIGRGGIKGLLSCSLRYINGKSFLYYDITSKQNIVQIYSKRSMSRQWVKDFMWNLQQIREELSRFLLDEQNVLWYPQQIYQDVETNVFSLLYIPYYAGDNGFGNLLEFMVEHIDYEDDKLVECVYKMYEQFEAGGQNYLQSQIFQDVEMLENVSEDISSDKVLSAERVLPVEGILPTEKEIFAEEIIAIERETNRESNLIKQPKKGFGNLFKNMRRKDKQVRDDYREAMQPAMAGYAVAEDVSYEDEEWGKTVFIQAPAVNREKKYCLYTMDGRMLARLEKESLTIGKRKEEVDIVLEDISVSRMHARIIREGDFMCLVDLNSTNGTYKNGVRLQPYEKRKLEAEDEIIIGSKCLIFKELS